MTSRYILTEEDKRLLIASRRNIERIIANTVVDKDAYRYIGKIEADIRYRAKKNSAGSHVIETETVYAASRNIISVRM